MLLRELFSLRTKPILKEGGNLSSNSPGWQGAPGEHEADELNLQVHNRTYVVDILNKLMHDINTLFHASYNKTIWPAKALASRKFLSGSSFHFFDKNIPDEDFVRLKPKVGDIDTQCPEELDPEVKAFLTSIINKQVGDAIFLGFSPGNNQYSSLWQVTLDELPVKLQIDFEFGKYDPETEEPDEWYAYSHSADWDDMAAGIKGVFHKYIDRALPYAQTSTKYVARVLKKSTKISPEPVTDSDYSFAVSGKQGGGLSNKYIPYIDPATGEAMEHNGIPVMQQLEPSDANRHYEKNVGKQFEIFFGKVPTPEERKLLNSFVGTIQLMNTYLEESQRVTVVERFLDICFEPGNQMITKNDPARDRALKFAAIDYALENLDAHGVGELRKKAVDMSKAYEQAFTAKQGGTPINEAEVKAQFRKGMPHLRDLKPIDLLDLIDELHDGNGNFKLENIPLNLKVDGFGGRFGKNSEGRPFMGTSRTEPRYEAGFVAYHKAKGTQDPEILGRAQLFDQLFEEMMQTIATVDEHLGPEFLIDKQVTCEVLFLPFASQQEDGRLKFVGISYDKLPAGVELALVPFRVTNATTGEDLPDTGKIVKQLTALGQMGSVMFINNSLTQKDSLDVTAIIPPLENIEALKAMLSSTEKGINDRKKQVADVLKPVALGLEQAIIEDPNIVGKDMLGQDYEGIVLNTRLGPVKVTSAEQKKIIADKNAAIKAARPPQPGATQRSGRIAVVAPGSFVGHKGHQQLAELVINKANEVGGDPYVFISPTVGPDDPIPPDLKLATWHKLYPNQPNIFQLWQLGGTWAKKIEKELVTASNPPPYDKIIVMVGDDRYAGAKKWMDTLSKRMKNPQYPGFEHVEFEVIRTERDPSQGGTGISFTQCRDILKQPNTTEEQQLKFWCECFNESVLGSAWIKKIMDAAKAGMGVPATPVSENKKSIKYANRIIREMRAKEFLSETKPEGKIHPHAVDAGQGAMRMRDVGGYDRTYHLNRIWMATAMADGRSKKPVDMDSASFAEKYNVAFPYTDIEHMMVLQAMATIPTDGKELTKRSKSKEPDDTNKVSAVAKPKKNQYGV